MTADESAPAGPSPIAATVLETEVAIIVVEFNGSMPTMHSGLELLLRAATSASLQPLARSR